jgi:hypothetical protein
MWNLRSRWNVFVAFRTSSVRIDFWRNCPTGSLRDWPDLIGTRISHPSSFLTRDDELSNWFLICVFTTAKARDGWRDSSLDQFSCGVLTNQGVASHVPVILYQPSGTVWYKSVHWSIVQRREDYKKPLPALVNLFEMWMKSVFHLFHKVNF